MGSEVHLLLVGHSTGHVDAVAENGARNVIMFTTEDCMGEARLLTSKLGTRGINVIDVRKLDPFSADSVSEMAKTITETCDQASKAGLVPVIGLTGGTNLMVAAMCLVALRKGLKCHYVSRQSGTISPVDISAAYFRIGGVV